MVSNQSIGNFLQQPVELNSVDYRNLSFEEHIRIYGEGNLIFCCKPSWENYFRSVGRQNNNNNPKFQGRYI